jgi:hypothetical protein
MSQAEVLTPVQMKELYGAFYAQSPRVRLRGGEVPEELHPLLHYAEFWGIADDVKREALVEQAPLPVKKNLKEVVTAFDDLFDNWLAGEEASNPNPSTAYVAYSAMRMASDFI